MNDLTTVMVCKTTKLVYIIAVKFYQHTFYPSLLALCTGAVAGASQIKGLHELNRSQVVVLLVDAQRLYTEHAVCDDGNAIT